MYMMWPDYLRGLVRLPLVNKVNCESYISVLCTSYPRPKGLSNLSVTLVAAVCGVKVTEFHICFHFFNISLSVGADRGEFYFCLAKQ